MLEVVERDALALWWYNRISHPRIAPPESPFFVQLRSSLQSSGRQFWLLDLTTDLGIPVVAALCSKLSGEAVYIGAAADTSPTIAARRAAAEMIQFLVLDGILQPPASRRHWLTHQSLQSQPWLSGNINSVRRATALPRDLASLDAYWIDLTRPWLGIPTVRVFIPSLLTASRLRQLPVRLGWLPAPRSVSELTPYPTPL